MTRLSFYLRSWACDRGRAARRAAPTWSLATTPPLFTGLAGLAIARMNRAPFVLDVRDLWPAAATSSAPDLARLGDACRPRRSSDALSLRRRRSWR